VLGALPRRRPHRRSAKRAAPPETINGNGNGTDGQAPERRSVASRPQATRARGARPKAAKPAGATKPTPARAAKPAPAATKPAPAATKPAPARAAKPAPPATRPVPARPTARRRPQPLRQPAQPAGVPPTSHGRPADEQQGRHVLGTAAQAAAELAEIGLSVSARALRRVVDRLPRP